MDAGSQGSRRESGAAAVSVARMTSESLPPGEVPAATFRAPGGTQ